MLAIPNRRSSHHRHSVLHLGIDNYNDNDLGCSAVSLSSFSFSPCSSSSSPPNSVSSNGDRDTLPYNIRLIRAMRRDGQRPLPCDISELRRECRIGWMDAAGSSERRQRLSESVDTARELLDMVVEGDDAGCADPLLISEYQAFVAWVYSTARTELAKTGHIKQRFQELKSIHRRLFSALPPDGEERLMCVLRFSQLCLEYAEVCDSEAISWCRRAASLAPSRPHSSSSASIGRKRAQSVQSSGDTHLEERRRLRRMREAGELLCHNVTQIELSWTETERRRSDSSASSKEVLV